jgi:WS/DGAT/MGAT family acyltransferase
MSEQLSALDATFLELEEADEAAHMHIGAILVFEPGPEGAPSTAALCAQLDERLHLLPRFRDRLSERRTGGLRWPAWERDPGFDVAAHVRRAALPSPGGERELLDFAGDYWSHRLERGRPLWELTIIEGLAEGRWALATKTHHAMVDGVGSVDTSHLLLDVTPERDHAEGDAPPIAEDHGHGDAGFWPLDLVRGGLRAGVGAARAGVDAALHPHRLVEALDRSRALTEVLVRDELQAAPATSLNARIGGRRRYEALEVSLAEIKRIKSALGGTVNDVVLAATSAGLRSLLLARSEDPPRDGLRAMVPVNIRSAGDGLTLGNRVASLFVTLPVAEPEPRRRYDLACGEAEALKSGSQLLGGETLLDLTSHAPPVLHSLLARSLFATRLFNVTITNVPGPQMPLYAFGAQMRSVLPLVPLATEHCLGIAVVSYNGSLTFGLSADYDTVPDLPVLREGIADALEELHELAASEPHAPKQGAKRGG